MGDTFRDSIYYEKDTLAYGKLYRKIRYQYEFAGLLIREDTQEGKVWGRIMPHPDFYPHYDTSEVLIYDFSLMSGDTFPISIEEKWTTLSVDSVYYLDGKRHISFRPEGAAWVNPEMFEFIEGIGSNYCIEYFMPGWFRYRRYLICAYKDDTVSCRNKRYEGNCDVRFEDVSIPALSTGDDIHVYPNPVQNVLHLSRSSGGGCLSCYYRY